MVTEVRMCKRLRSCHLDRKFESPDWVDPEARLRCDALPWDDYQREIKDTIRIVVAENIRIEHVEDLMRNSLCQTISKGVYALVNTIIHLHHTTFHDIFSAIGLSLICAISIPISRSFVVSFSSRCSIGVSALPIASRRFFVSSASCSSCSLRF
jgi:hypothetical protein